MENICNVKFNEPEINKKAVKTPEVNEQNTRTGINMSLKEWNRPPEMSVAQLYTFQGITLKKMQYWILAQKWLADGVRKYSENPELAKYKEVHISKYSPCDLFTNKRTKYPLVSL